MRNTSSTYILSAACGIGANNPGCSLGPIILQASAFLTDLPLNWQEVLYVHASEPKLAAIPAIAEFSNRLAEAAYSLVSQNKLLLTLGGDQSCSIGMWSGVAAAIRKQGALGLIWIDAHMDSHTPENTLSGNVHGMPLATLLGYGAAELTHIIEAKPKLNPAHVCLIGVRSYEPSELELLNMLGVRIFFIDEVKQKGLHTVMQEALQIVKHNTAGYGISVDIDAIDPHDAPAVGVPEPNGIAGEELINALKLTQNDAKLIATEIVEFNPNLDQGRKTEKLISDIIHILTAAQSVK